VKTSWPTKRNPFYESPRWRKLREQIRRRDNFTCRVCGVQSRRVVVDHIVPLRVRPDLGLHPANLQLLCPACHGGAKRAAELSAKRGEAETGLDGFPVGSDWS